jgi:hypothetical protein
MPKLEGTSGARGWDRVLLGCLGIIAFVTALLVRHDTTNSTLALALAGLAGLLVVLALLLPYLAGVSASAAGFSLDLSLVAAKPEGVTVDQSDSLRGRVDPATGKAANASGPTGFAELLRGGDIEFFAINLGRGDQWLASRLLIFTVVMRQLRQVRCVVFTAATGVGGRKCLLGLAASEDVHQALAWEYPWLEEKLFAAWKELTAREVAAVDSPAQGSAAVGSPQAASARAQAASGASIAKPIRVANLDADRAEQLFTSYRKLLGASDPEDADIDQWTELEYGGWEHAPLLNAEGLRRLLGGSLDSRSVRRSRSRSQQLAAVLAIDAPYVAVVDDDCRFVSLVDRQALLEELALQARLRLERSSDTG